ncbi:MAG: hypothetical protein D6692_11340, partial [Planctomycetota bacterium]
MAHIHIPSEIPLKYVRRPSSWAALCGVLFVIGLGTFVYTLNADPVRAWSDYVSNWLYFTSVAMGAVLFGAVTWIVKAKWNWSVRRVSLAFGAFLPISFLLLLPMLGLGENFFPWIAEMAHDPIIQKKAAYLNKPFLMTRNVVGALLLFGLAGYFIYLALRPDLGLVKDDGDAGRARWRERLTQDYAGQEAEEVRSYQRMTRIAPAMVLLYAVVMSIFSYDWVMSLNPHWFSTMMGPWFFMGAFWMGVVATYHTVVGLKRSDRDFDRAMGRQQMHDLGKLAFAFCVFWAYLFFAQYLVIWYGKLPHEQSFIIERSRGLWGTLSVVVILCCFVLPFAGLVGKKGKMTPGWVRFITLVPLFGIWLERHLMVMPSLRPAEEATFGLTEPLIALMFLGPFLYSVRWFLSTFPVIQMWQPMV